MDALGAPNESRGNFARYFSGPVPSFGESVQKSQRGQFLLGRRQSGLELVQGVMESLVMLTVSLGLTDFERRRVADDSATSPALGTGQPGRR